MSNILFRPAELVACDDRQVTVRVPYGVTYAGDDGTRDRFEPGAFTRSVGERAGKLRLMLAHADGRSALVGRASGVVEQPDGVVATFAVDPSAGGEAVRLLNSGGATVHVGFRSHRQRVDGGLTCREEAALMEVTVTPAAVRRVSRANAERRLLLLNLELS